ncbi:hypothetical protein [Streptomyces sp. NPDC056544]
MRGGHRHEVTGARTERGRLTDGLADELADELAGGLAIGRPTS